MPPTWSSAVNSHQQLLVVCRVSSSLSNRSNVSHVFAGRTLILFAMARIDSPLPPMFLLCAGSVCPGACLARPDPCSHRVSYDSTLRSFLRPRTKAPNTWRRPTRYQADGSVPFKRWGCSSFSVFMGRDAGKTRNACVRVALLVRALGGSGCALKRPGLNTLLTTFGALAVQSQFAPGTQARFDNRTPAHNKTPLSRKQQKRPGATVLFAARYLLFRMLQLWCL